VTLITLRRFHVVAPPPGVPITNADISHAGSFAVELPLALALRQNAYAVPRRGLPTYALVRHEMELVLTVFPQSTPGTPLRRDPLYDASASHIRRFAIEALGLGALTRAMQHIHGPVTDLAHFDVLPAALQQVYPRNGIRPDLRFDYGCGVVAGESRGRSQTPSATPRSEQRIRLDQLLAWSRQPGCDPVAMAWTWVQPTGTTVDLFEVPVARVPPSMRVVAELLHARRVANLAWPPSTGERDDVVGSETATDRVVDMAKSLLLESGMEEREDALFESAPHEVVRGAERRWLGTWRQVRRPDGEVVAHMLLAVTGADERVPRRRPRDVPPERDLRATGVEVALAGRLLVAVDWRGDPEAAADEIGRADRDAV